MPRLTRQENQALKDVSKALNVPPKKLSILINFESRWDPQALNKISGARGLIQFIPSTAKRMGFHNSLDLVTRYPTIKSQLEGPVYSYLKAFKPFKNDQSLFFSVFYPKARTWPLYKRFPLNVRKSNPGINTPADYMRKVYFSSGLPFVPPFLILLGIATILYITNKRQKKGGKHGREEKKAIKGG